MNLSVCDNATALPTDGPAVGGCRVRYFPRISGICGNPADPLARDRNAHGGMGIMIDDIVAGVISAGILYFIGHHWPPVLFLKVAGCGVNALSGPPPNNMSISQAR